MELMKSFQDVLATHSAAYILDSEDLSRQVTANAEQLARWIAQNLDRRDELVGDSVAQRSLQQALATIWTALESCFDPSKDVLVSTIDFAIGLAKFERNWVAGLESQQTLMLSHEPTVRGILFNLTTFTRIEDPQWFTLQAILTQLLSNLISPASSSQQAQSKATEYLTLYLSGKREDDVLIRLLDSNDQKVNNATLRLIHNMVRDSSERMDLLFSSTGIQWLSKILDKMDIWLERDPEDGRFELSTLIFNQFISTNLQSRLFGELAARNEPISPSQTTFLKILDSYLSNHPPPPRNLNTPSSRSAVHPNRFLIIVFHLLSAYAITSITRVPDDARLPKVFEGLVLVSEGLINIGLSVQAQRDSEGIPTIPAQESHDEILVEDMKSSEDGEGLIKPIIDSIQGLNDFLPRLNPRISAIEEQDPLPHIPPDHIRPIAQLKRNLVQLLGVLTYNDKSTSDQVRQYGGVQLILSLTEVDESNPYLREHALFVVRNLMLHNPENQAIISQMDPVGVLSETGEVLPVPERMRRHTNGTM